MKTFKFENGQKVTDTVSGLNGTVVARADYVEDYRSYLVQPRTKPDGDPIEAQWIGEQRLNVA
ncbi:MAG: hypothetical protein JWR80_7974 [Bradyrhizobium sp.]|nr:hypothetical protein [Bradyrhizobium sp.]